MRTLITGGEGQLGSDLLDRFAPDGETVNPDLDDLDVTDPETVREYIARFRPDRVIHAAAWTDVDGCEGDRERAFLVNEEGSRIVAAEARAAGAPLVVISTDFVFDGSKDEPYDEEDEPSPASIYGKSKLAGERAALDAHPGAAIARTAWLYGVKSRGNFVTAILNRARQGKALRVVNDQFGSPTFSLDVADAVFRLVETGEGGIYHVVNSGEASRLEFARAILDLSGREDVPIEPIDSAELTLPAPRPARSTLAASRLAALGIAPLRHWRAALIDYLERTGERSG